MKALVVDGFCAGGELGDVVPGQEIDLSYGQYQQELYLGRIEEPPLDDSAAKAAALAQAHAELLQQIAAAPDHAALEALLSEDPEIVAAYDKRLAELDEPNH